MRSPAKKPEMKPKVAVEPFEPQHRLILLNISKSVRNLSVDDAARRHWTISQKKTPLYELVLAHADWVVRGVYQNRPTDWVFDPEATLAAKIKREARRTVPKREKKMPKYRFEGPEADEETRTLYIDKGVPEKYRNRGSKYVPPTR